MIKASSQQIIETGDFAGQVTPSIHLLENSRQLFDVYRLTYDCYVANGTSQSQFNGLWIPHPSFDHIQETKILVAELEGEVVGTVSVTVDGTRGLPLDENFQRTCMLTRGQGRRLAQVWRLLVKESCPLREPILTSLVTEAVNMLLSQNVQTCLYLIPEQDAALCRQMLNTITLTRARSAPGFSQAWSILMRGEVEKLKSSLPVMKGGLRERLPHPHSR